MWRNLSYKSDFRFGIALTMGKMKNHRCLKCNRGTMVHSDKHTLCISCLGGEHFVDLKDRVCEQCKGLGDSTYRRRRYDWVARQADRFKTMLEKEGQAADRPVCVGQQYPSPSVVSLRVWPGRYYPVGPQIWCWPR